MQSVMSDRSPIRYTCIMCHRQDRKRPTGRIIMLSDTSTAKSLVELPVDADATVEWHQKDVRGIACDIGSTILQNLNHLKLNPPDELARRLPTATWTQVFAAVEQLVRNGQLTRRQPSRCEYVSTPSPAAPSERKNSLATPHAYRSCSESHLHWERIVVW